jgi:uncharacterized protein with HEPN domain
VSLSPHEYIHHILDEIDFILAQISDLNYDSFVKNPALKRAFVQSLEIVGEASKNFLTMLGQCNRISSGVKSPECVIGLFTTILGLITP